jgi:hypothetical protein
MSRNETYFQFPLCALAYGATVDERLNAILAYGVVVAGQKLWRSALPETQGRFRSQLGQGWEPPTGFKRDNALHLATLYGLQTIGVTTGGLTHLIERYHRLCVYVANFESIHGRDSLVRIKTLWLFKARDRQGLAYREFAVLCAIYSSIGNKAFARVTQPRIRRCALGYRKETVMHVELAKRIDGAKPLTERELKTILQRLHRNKFFARRTAFRRFTYYSIRLNNEDLGKRIVARHTYPKFHRESQAAQDLALTAEITRRRLNQP